MSSLHAITTKVNAFNEYIANVSNRDRVTSILQFTSMALYEPAAACGFQRLSVQLKMLNELSSLYRTLTRFSQWLVVVPLLTPKGIRDTIESHPRKLIGVLKTISMAFFTVFLFGEEICLFANYKLLNPVIGKKFNRIRFVFLFWSNIVRLISNYLLFKESTYTPERDGVGSKKATEHRRKVLTMADGILMSLFSYALLKISAPTGPQNLNKALKSRDISSIIACFAPPVSKVHDTPHGILGILASIPGFMLSLT